MLFNSRLESAIKDVLYSSDISVQVYQGTKIKNYFD